MSGNVKRLLAVVAVLCLVMGACGRNVVVPVGTLTALGGVVEISRAGGSWQTLDDTAELAPGDQVRSGPDGSARLVVSDRGVVELGASSLLVMGSEGSAEVRAGAVLAEGSGFALRVGRASISPHDEGAFRIDRALSTRVGVYRGAASVAALGTPVVVDQLWQTVVLAHAVPTAPSPLRVSVVDPWDRRILGDAIAVGRGLISLERAVRPRVGRQPAPAAAIARAVGAQVSPRSVSGLLRTHDVSQSQVFMSLAIARQADAGVLPTARDILQRVELGATWIVVVAALELARPSLLATVGRILAAIPSLPGIAAAEPSASPEGSPGAGESPSGEPSSSPPPEDPGGGGPGPGPGACSPDDQACEFQQAVDGIIGGISGEDRDDDPGDGIPPPIL